MAAVVVRLLEANGLTDIQYVEPYAGGSAIALDLLFGEHASVIHINDLSRPVYAFWYSVLNDTKELCRRIERVSVTMREWRKQRAVYDQRDKADIDDLGFAALFLNRTNRSGIIHSGGMIGGNMQTGEWKLDARYNKKELISRIETIAAYSNRISVSNKDAETLLKTLTTLPTKTLIFLDPPYFRQGQSLYENHYQPEDHIRLAEVFKKKLRRNWIISYDNQPQIRKAYRGCRKLIYSLPYSAARRYEGSEVMFFSADLAIPRVKNPLLA